MSRARRQSNEQLDVALIIPRIKLRRNTSQSIPNVTDTTMVYDEVVYSRNAGFSYNIGTGEVTALKKGLVDVRAAITTATDSWTAGQQLLITVFKNGVVQDTGRNTSPSASLGMSALVATEVEVEIGDVLTIRVQQNASAGTINVVNAAGNYNYCTMSYRGQ